MNKYVYVILCMLLTACRNDGSLQKNTAKEDTPRSNKLIPYTEDSAARKSRQEPFLNNLGKVLGLPTDYNTGKRGTNIRIWLWDGEEHYVVDISNSEAISDCRIIKFSGKKVGKDDFVNILQEWKHLQPEAGWANFLSKTNEYKILSLESGTIQQKKAIGLTNASYVQFEISDDTFRLYEYLEPSYYRKIDTGSNNVYQFLKFLSKEMKVPVYTPAENLFVES